MSVSVPGSAARLDIGKVLTEGLGALAKNFGPFFLMALVLQGVPSALAAWGRVMGPTSLVGGLFGLVAGAAGLVTTPMLMCALIYGTMRQLEGRPAPIEDCIDAASRKWFPMLGLLIVLGFLVTVGLLLLVVPGVFLALRWSVAGPVLVLEDRSIPESMGRSADLTRNRRWAILLLLLIYLGVSLVVGLAVGAAGLGVFTVGGSAPVLAVLLAALINIASSLILHPVATALFRQLRGDMEGGNPELLGEVFA